MVECGARWEKRTRCQGARMEAQGEITQQLLVMRNGEDPTTWDRLVPLVYAELRAIAHRQLRREAPGHTLTTTALVHEAYLRLADYEEAPWLDRAHFFALASRVMRRLLIDYARQHHAAKRDAGNDRVPYYDALAVADGRAETLIALDDALTRLGAVHERMARVVECRFFGGLTEEETAVALGVTARTVRRDWVKAKGWLLEELGERPA